MKHTDLGQHPSLNGTPSLATRKTQAIHELAAEANLIIQLIDCLKACSGLRECDKYSPDFYMPDEHLRAIERGDYRKAYNLIVNYGIST